MPPLDPRRVVGARVNVRAILISNPAECKRRYGSNHSKKVVGGTVVDVEIKPSSTAGGRAQTFIKANWELGGGTIKTASANVRSVYPGEPPATAPPLAPPAPPLAPAGGAAASASASASASRGAASGSTASGGAATGSTASGSTASGSTASGAAAGPAPAATAEPTLEPHGRKWVADDAASKRPINGEVAYRDWYLKTPVGDKLGPGSDPLATRSRLEYFQLLFPPPAMSLILTETNIQLQQKNKRTTTEGEIVKFFGLWILMTRYEFGERRSLWSTTSQHKYVPAPKFGMTGMSRDRFEVLWSCIRFSRQPPERPAGTSCSTYRWMLVDDFVSLFNAHRAAYFVPSHILTADESIFRWYGMGGSWINEGLPMYIAIDRKPEDGCEIQNTCDGISGVMLYLKIVKAAEDVEGGEHDDAGLPHGGKVLKELVLPWANTNRIVCADSYFASVPVALELLKIGLRFIGVVKTATKQFPMAWLSSQEMNQRGDRIGLVSRNDEGHPHMLSLVFMDRNRQYFIATASSMAEGEVARRTRWRQENPEPNAPPERVEIELPQPLVTELYYAACGKIDQHNRVRQDDLMIERKFRTTEWWKRIAQGLIGMVVVDTWFVYKACTGSKEEKCDFFCSLAEEMIDNNIDGAGGTARARRVSTSPRRSPRQPPAPSTGYGVRLTPAKRKRKSKGVETIHAMQGKCRVCQAKTTTVCSACIEQGVDEASAHYCKPGKRSKLCFSQHVGAAHLVDD